ncbi:MAG: DUF2817 domain-containing protein [Rhodospirillum sp.]|nr:DUF2817 domain-containing protein [Rhodospirillum sp.]
MDSFSESYAEARAKFLAAARDAGARIHSYGRDDVVGLAGEPLLCDVAVLGAERGERAAIAITGTHGVEGYAGSAVLHHWLTNRGRIKDDIQIVLVHAINPWAFSHKTRTTENNVDLNRNFIRDNIGYERQNPGYDSLAPFFDFDPTDARRALDAYRGYKAHLDRNGWHLENEMLEGQCDRPDGLFYAGKEPEWSNLLFRRIVTEHLGAARTIGFVDWHTGVGSFGEIVYLMFDEPGSAEHAAASRWWNRELQEKSAFKSGSTPKYRGLLCQSIRQELPDARIAGAVVEFGTADDYAIFRGDCLDRWVRFEGREATDAAQFREAYKDIMNPPDPSWRRMVLDEGPAVMDKLIAGVAGW